MSHDKKTLADVQPGGMVRLATVPYDRARDLLGDAYNAGTHGIGYSQQAMELHDAIFPAQPSPGGQDALAALEQDKSHNLHLIAAKKVEAVWRSRNMAPCCPHCGRGILPEDKLGDAQTRRDFELRRRQARPEEGKKGMFRG